MIAVAMKMIKNDRARFFLTVLGFVVSATVLLLGLYYWRISKNIVDDNINEAFSKRLVVTDEVNVPLMTYRQAGDDFVPAYEEISDDELESITSHKGVTSACVHYLAPDDFVINCEGIRVTLTENYAVKAGSDSFSKAREEVLKKQDPDFQVMVAGDGLSEDDPYEVLLNEAFSVSMGWTAEEAVGKRLTLSVPELEDIELKVAGIYSARMSSWIGAEIEELSGWLTYEPQGESNTLGNVALFNEALFEMLSEKTGKEEYTKPADIVLSMKDTAYIEDLIRDLQKEHSLNAQSDYMELFDQFEKQTEFTWAFIIVGTVLSVLVLIMVVNSICINIYRQKRFSELLGLLGYNRQNLCRLYAFQSLLYGFTGSCIGAVLTFLFTSIIGMRNYSALEQYGFTSSQLLLPVHYIVPVVCIFSLLSLGLGYIAAAVKVKRRYEPGSAPRQRCRQESF